MVVTDNKNVADMLTITRANGWDRNLTIDKQRSLRAEHGIDDFMSKYTFYELGYNLRPTEINGFIGCETLPYLDEIIYKEQRKSASAASESLSASAAFCASSRFTFTSATADA